MLKLDEIAKLHKPGRHRDGDGLYVQVQPGGSKSWLFRYRLDGRESWMGLGPVDLERLGENAREARRRAAEARAQLSRGEDPLAAKRAQAALQNGSGLTTGKTFEECARAYIAAHEADWKMLQLSLQSSLGWSSADDPTMPPLIDPSLEADVPAHPLKH